MNTKQLEYFLEMAKTLNYSKASENLDIAQPTLSKAMSHLADECGFKLFKKEGRNLVLTDEAKQFLPYVRNSILTLNKGLEAISEKKETIRIGMVLATTTFIPNLIKEIKSINNHYYIKIVNGISSELTHKLLNNEVDIVVCTPTTQYKEIVFAPIIKQNIYMAVYKEHPYANRKNATISMLNNQDIIAHGEGSIVRNLFTSLITSENLKINIVAEADEDKQIASMVRNKMGISVFSTDDPTQYSNIVLLPLVQDKIDRVFSIGYLKDNLTTAKIVKKIKKNIDI